MTWLTWRQHRWEALITAALVTIIAAVNVVQGSRAAGVSADLGISACLGGFLPPSCSAAFERFDREFGWMKAFPAVFFALPALVAPFLGAPLVSREHEFRTSLFVWAQGVTRRRWLVTKTLMFAGALAAAAILLATVATVAQQAWSYRPMRWHDALDWTLPVMLSTTLFALALGIFCGTVTRRVLGAMLLALALVAVVRIGVASQVRPQYLAPIVATSRHAIPADAWILSSHYVDAEGTVVPIDRIIQLSNEFFRSGANRSFAESDEYFVERGVFFRATYQPKERNEPYQLIEGGLYSALTAALFAASLWLVRRRPA